jgi:hypothetical protein
MGSGDRRRFRHVGLGGLKRWHVAGSFDQSPLASRGAILGMGAADEVALRHGREDAARFRPVSICKQERVP